MTLNKLSKDFITVPAGSGGRCWRGRSMIVGLLGVGSRCM